MGYSRVIAVLVLLHVARFGNPYIWEGVEYDKPKRACSAIVRGNKAGEPFVFSHKIRNAEGKRRIKILPIDQCKGENVVGVEAIGCDTELPPFVALTPDYVAFVRAQPPPWDRNAALRVIVFCKRKKTLRNLMDQGLFE